jgi:Response regulator containing a CheY-like receiver domain and an HTH DNA-binding domain
MISGGPLRVMLVDDHAQVRSAVRQALDADDIEVVGEASSGDEALRMAPQLNPDVLLLDLRMPDMDGLDLLRELAPRLPGTRIVMFTVSDDRRDVFEAMRSGAAGYLTKDLTPDALQRSIRGVRSGHLPMSRTMAAEVIRHLTAAARHFPAAPGEGDFASLSPREREVLGYLADNLTDRQIGDQLDISPRTVGTHVSSILEKLGVHNRGQAARALRALDRQQA